ncbi:30388_t:CDS:2, partial [Racocetra persica]
EIEEFDDNIQANANRIGSNNAKTAQQEEGQKINNFFQVSKKNQNVFKNPLDHEHVDNNQQEKSVNCDHEINEETEEFVSSDQPSINDISNMLEQVTLTKNADDDC